MHNKKRISLIIFFINFVSVSLAPQILSSKDDCNYNGNPQSVSLSDLAIDQFC